MVDYSQVRVNREGFATIKTPVSASGMMRHALDIEAVFNDLLNGEGRRAKINRLLFTTASAKTISGGIVSTPTLAQHTITSQSGTADDLDTIGSSNNTFLFIRATAGHVITARNGTGNITVPGGTNLILSGNITALLWCEDGQWSVLGTTLARVNPSGTTDPGSGEDALDGYSVGSIWVNTSKKRAWICTNNTATTARWKRITSWRNSFRFRGSGASTLLGIGCANPTTSGSLGSVSTAENVYTTISGSSSGVTYGWYTTSYDLVRVGHDPIVEIIVRTYSNITSTRIWVGLTSAQPNDGDTLTAGTKFIGFRFSTVATDGGFKPVLNDGTTQSTGSAMNTLAGSTAYKLRMRVDSSNSTVYFSIDDGAEVSMATNFPAAATDMGLAAIVIPQAAAFKELDTATCEVGW